MRSADVERKTKETEIDVSISLDSKGEYLVKTPNGFFTHMLELLSKHSGISMDISVKGDTEVDLHHTVEDTGIVLGQALASALGDRKGIERYSSVMMVMDEVRCDVAVDLGGRSNIVYRVPRLNGKFNESEGFDYSMIKEFMKALCDNLKATIHIEQHEYPEITDDNRHHIAEAVFKGLARALSKAVKITGTEIPSSKGVI